MVKEEQYKQVCTTYASEYVGQEVQARNLILKKKFLDAKTLACTTAGMVDKIINSHYFVVRGENQTWLLIPKEKLTGILQYSEIISR